MHVHIFVHIVDCEGVSDSKIDFFSFEKFLVIFPCLASFSQFLDIAFLPFVASFLFSL